MKAGLLRHRVIIQSRPTGQNTYGEQNGTWATWKTRRAEIVPLSGQEQELDQQTASIASHRVRLRYLPSLTTDHRILFGTRIFNIHSVLNTEERNVEHVLRCSEVMPAP